MATLNTSSHGPSISKSYQSIINAPNIPASKSSTYGHWAVFSVSAPLANAFQQDLGAKESVLKVQATGDGELSDLVDEFSDGRIQFAFGYHVQITARSDRDLLPESIVQKVSDASGSRYSGATPAVESGGPPLPVSSKPAYTPTQTNKVTSGFNPLKNSRDRISATKDTGLDEDGWGADAPQVTRTELEKVQSAYQPTRVDLRQLSSHEPEPSKFKGFEQNDQRGSDVVKGTYQPVGKVDIAALRQQGQQRDDPVDDRPTPVKGAYEPVGKVDIAAIRAKAQNPSENVGSTPNTVSPAITGNSTQSNDRRDDLKPSLDRSTAYDTSERMTTLPKPKVANRFGSGAQNFMGTKPHAPGGFGLDSKSTPASPPVHIGRTFADQAGKTPAQLWAEKKAREAGTSKVSSGTPATGNVAPVSPIASQNSGGGEWKSGYSGKNWAPVQTTRTGQSSSGVAEQRTGDETQANEDSQPAVPGGIGALRDRFKGTVLMGAPDVSHNKSIPSPPPLDTSNKPNAGRGVLVPGLPSQSIPVEAPKDPSPPSSPQASSNSPIRVAMPVSRGLDTEFEDNRNEETSPAPVTSTESHTKQFPQDDTPINEHLVHGVAPGSDEATATVSTLSDRAVNPVQRDVNESGNRALVQYDYEKAEDNELELREGEVVTNIDMVDADWWMGENPRGETGLFPSNYVELIGDNHPPSGAHQLDSEPEPRNLPSPVPATGHTALDTGHTATALFDYEAAEDNELSFPENAKIVDIEFPDDDWWSGEYNGKQGLFPANYVQLDQ
ncbi:MAG: hypothetical protein LQ342_004860 [Letrouitia transgressa]|nr:MAG: hypothetical protein LQ342_004860 [Letrouitia transgressa]